MITLGIDPGLSNFGYAVLNGGKFVPLTQADWELIHPYLEENERQFGISIREDLLTVGGRHRNPVDIYRKVVPVRKI